MTVFHSNAAEASQSFAKTLSEVQTSERWMAAAWRVSNEKIELVGTTTYQFKRGDYLRAVAQLADRCFDMQEARNLPDTPLPSALKCFPGTSQEQENGNGDGSPVVQVDSKVVDVEKTEGGSVQSGPVEDQIGLETEGTSLEDKRTEDSGETPEENRDTPNFNKGFFE